MKSIDNILTVIDDNQLSRDILKKSIELAKLFNAKIIVLYTIHIPFFDLPSYKKDVPINRESVKNSIDTIFNELNMDNMVKHHTLVYFGDSSNRAIVEAKRDNIDLIITGEHIKYEKLLRESQKSILIIKNGYREYKNILIPTDLTIKSKESIEFIKSSFSGNLALVHGYESIAVAMSMYDIGYIDMVEYQEENRDIALSLLDEFSKEVGVRGELTDATFSLPYGILDYIKKAKPDLVVVASHSSEDNFFVGSTSSYLAKESPFDIFIYN